MKSSTLGAALMLIGVVVFLLGTAVRIGAPSWFGKLPGDIRIEREGFRFYFPVVTMILLSVLASLVVYLVRRFL